MSTSGLLCCWPIIRTRGSASQWWESDTLAKDRFLPRDTISVLRLLTTAAAMNGKPLAMKQAWQAYDRLFEDDRVSLAPEPVAFEPEFRRLSYSRAASHKVCADAYLLAFAARTDATIITFDRALEDRGVKCLVLR